jgi:perosamine synthetase
MISRVHPSYSYVELQAALAPAPDSAAQFENELAASYGMKHALVFPYGRSAIHAALSAFELRGNIVQPAYNCVVVAHATVLAGARPVFVDCQPNDPNQAQDAMIDAVDERTAAIIPTCIFGMTFDAPALVSALRRKNSRALILMDCAQSFDVSWRKERIISQGDAAILAFGIGKAMTTLFGGALLTNRDDLARALRNYRARAFRSPGRFRTWGQLGYFLASWIAVTGIGANAADWIERRGAFNALRSRESIRLPKDNQTSMTDLQAAIGRVQLLRLNAFGARRQEISERYERALMGIRGAQLPSWAAGSTHTIYTLRLNEPEHRLTVLSKLRRQGVQGGSVLDYVVPDLDCYRERGYIGDYPNARTWAESALNLPNYPTLSDEQVDYCAAALRGALG